MAVKKTIPTQLVLIILIISWCISIYIFMYLSTSCSDKIDELSSQQRFISNTITKNIENNDNENKIMSLKQEIHSLNTKNYYLQTKIDKLLEFKQSVHNTSSTTIKPKSKSLNKSPKIQRVTSQQAKMESLSLNELLSKLNKIPLESQINRINDLYENTLKWNYVLDTNDIKLNKKRDRKKSKWNKRKR